jgi:tetratricopeptide (TPR) repeat protein
VSLTFICENPVCPAPTSKKGKVWTEGNLLSAECPFCDMAMTQQNSFSELEERLIISLPYLIAYPLRRALLEQHGQSKVTLLKDTFLNYLKYLGLLSASEFFASDIKNKNMVSLFQNTLAEPSFGKWNTFIRETLKFLKANDHRFFIPELIEYYDIVESGEKKKLYKGNIEVQDLHGETQIKEQKATGIGMLINFRNRYLGHGQTLAKAEYVALWEEYSPIFYALLEQLQFASKYKMYKNEHGTTVKLQTFELMEVEHSSPLSSKVWLENPIGEKLDIVPFFVVPGELSIAKEDKEKLLAYEAYTGKTIKFFSPEGTEKQSSGRTLERLNMLLRDKQHENTFNAEAFTKEVFAERIKEENKLLLDTLIAERKVMPGIYVHREDMEIRIREWIGARMSIFFIAAEAGSGKTNLMVEAQRQYQERGLNSLFIRAGRMEKGTLMEQITYMLNLEKGKSLSDYPAIAGTQDAPTFIFIDGLNEASHSEAIWLEIVALAQLFDPGSIKFVVTSRANTSADLERYVLSPQEEDLLYRDDNKEGTDLKSSAFWLTALNMAEMKDAWHLYASKDKSRFKPLFSFDDIAGFDRGIYSQISNPLILKIFLEVYSGKHLASKGKKILNIWQDWLATFSSEERAFMEYLAKKIWETGVNELLLDDLLRDDTIKEYMLSDSLSSPYQRLKNLGWLSRYVKDLNLAIGFTLEGHLIYLLGVKLASDANLIDIPFAEKVVKEGNRIKISAIEEFLNLMAINGNLKLTKSLIDNQGDAIELCISPLLKFVKVLGVRSLIEDLFLEPTDGDWIALYSLDVVLGQLGLDRERKIIAESTINLNHFRSLPELRFGLKSMRLIEPSASIDYLKKIPHESFTQVKDPFLLLSIGQVFYHFSQYQEALIYFDKSIKIFSNDFNTNKFAIAGSYFFKGIIYAHVNKNEAALDCYFESLEIRLKFSINSKSKIKIYNAIGITLTRIGQCDKALEYLNESLMLALKYYGISHSSVALSNYLVGIALQENNDYANALNSFQRSLEIQLRIGGHEIEEVSELYELIGDLWSLVGDEEKALVHFEQSLDYKLGVLGNDDNGLIKLYHKIADIYMSIGEIEKAMEYYERGS